MVYRPGSNDYKTDQTGLGPFTQAQLQMKIAAGDTISVTGVPPGSGTRMGIDRDLDGVLDSDGPPFGSYGEWQNYWFTSSEASDPALGGASADFDHDGLPNLLEYALNLDPKKPQGAAISSPQIANGSLILTYTKIIDASDLTYTIDETSDFISWTPSDVTNEILADDGRIQIIKATVPIGNAQAKFLRLRIDASGSLMAKTIDEMPAARPESERRRIIH